MSFYVKFHVAFRKTFQRKLELKKISVTTNIISRYREYMDMETFLVQNQVFTIEEARNALEIEKNRSTLNNLLAYHLQKRAYYPDS